MAGHPTTGLVFLLTALCARSLLGHVDAALANPRPKVARPHFFPHTRLQPYYVTEQYRRFRELNGGARGIRGKRLNDTNAPLYLDFVVDRLLHRWRSERLHTHRPRSKYPAHDLYLASEIEHGTVDNSTELSYWLDDNGKVIEAFSVTYAMYQRYHTYAGGVASFFLHMSPPLSTNLLARAEHSRSCAAIEPTLANWNWSAPFPFGIKAERGLYSDPAVASSFGRRPKYNIGSALSCVLAPVSLMFRRLVEDRLLLDTPRSSPQYRAHTSILHMEGDLQQGRMDQSWFFHGVPQPRSVSMQGHTITFKYKGRPRVVAVKAANIVETHVERRTGIQGHPELVLAYRVALAVTEQVTEDGGKRNTTFTVGHATYKLVYEQERVDAEVIMFVSALPGHSLSDVHISLSYDEINTVGHTPYNVFYSAMGLADISNRTANTTSDPRGDTKPRGFHRDPLVGSKVRVMEEHSRIASFESDLYRWPEHSTRRTPLRWTALSRDEDLMSDLPTLFTVYDHPDQLRAITSCAGSHTSSFRCIRHWFALGDITTERTNKTKHRPTASGVRFSVVAVKGTLVTYMEAYDSLLFHYVSRREALRSIDLSIAIDYGSVLNGMAAYLYRSLEDLAKHAPGAAKAKSPQDELRKHVHGPPLTKAVEWFNQHLAAYIHFFFVQNNEGKYPYVFIRSAALAIVACEKMFAVTRHEGYVEYVRQFLLPALLREMDDFGFYAGAVRGRHTHFGQQAAAMLGLASAAAMPLDALRPLIHKQMANGLHFIRFHDMARLIPRGPLDHSRVRIYRHDNYYETFKAGLMLRALSRFHRLGDSSTAEQLRVKWTQKQYVKMENVMSTLLQYIDLCTVSRARKHIQRMSNLTVPPEYVRPRKRHVVGPEALPYARTELEVLLHYGSKHSSAESQAWVLIAQHATPTF